MTFTFLKFFFLSPFRLRSPLPTKPRLIFNKVNQMFQFTFFFTQKKQLFLLGFRDEIRF
jgi:hypothetical protein